MNFLWTSFLLSLLGAQVLSLQCYSCDGDSDCLETEICEEYQERCRTTIMKSRRSTYFLKGCDVGGKPNNSITHFSGNHVLLLAEEHCETDLCNEGVPNVVDNIPIIRSFQQRALQCYSCSSVAKTCFNSSLVQMTCLRPEETCVDIMSFTEPEEYPADEERIKGCGKLSHCHGPLGFHNEKSFHFIKCCNSSRCNDDMQDYKNRPLPLNGLKCYSCEGNATHGCSSDDVTNVQCRGSMTRCLEASGIHSISGQSAVLKGCASPSWCESPYTTVYKNLGTLYSRCCTGDLCNSQIINSSLKPAARSHASCKIAAQSVLLSTALLYFIAFLLS